VPTPGLEVYTLQAFIRRPSAIERERVRKASASPSPVKVGEDKVGGANAPPTRNDEVRATNTSCTCVVM